VAHVTCMLRTLPNFMKKRFHSCSLYVPRSNNEFACACMRSQNAFALDQTTDDLLCARTVRRSDLRQSRTTGRTRAAAPPTAHPSLTGRTPYLSKGRPASADTPRQQGSNLERGALPFQPETLLRGLRELFRCTHAAGVSGVLQV